MKMYGLCAMVILKSETGTHLPDCPFAKEFWRVLGWNTADDMPDVAHLWPLGNQAFPDVHLFSTLLVLLCCCWHLWKHRNAKRAAEASLPDGCVCKEDCELWRHLSLPRQVSIGLWQTTDKWNSRSLSSFLFIPSGQGPCTKNLTEHASDSKHLLAS